jgi:arylsulfatase A-like enzyme
MTLEHVPMPKNLLLFVLLIGAATTSLNTASHAAPPNILLVMVDDLGPADMACYGSKALDTPRLDAFARQGLKFNQAYAGCTVCAPTRSVLMTGVHMGRTSVRLNTGGVPLLDADVTIAELLRAAGYTTGGFGKWGLGDVDTPGAPERQGFDLFHGYYHQIHAHSYWPEYLIRNGKKEPNSPRQKGTAQGYSHYQTVEETKAFIRSAAKRQQPFFCYAPWCPPHGEYLLPADDPAHARYADKPWSKRAKQLAAMITMIDRHFGELLDLLDELAAADNTLVIFSSDNGGSEHADVIKALNPGGELQGHKRSMHEGGIRTPFLVRWPGQTEPGSETDFVVSHQDVLPTLAAIAGVAETIPDEVTGLSFVEVLRGAAPAEQHDYHYWEWPQWNWGKKAEVPDGLMQALRQGEWKILRNRADQPWRLYHVPNDPGERNDLAAKHPDKVQALAQLAQQARVPMRPQQEPRMPAGKPFR